MFQFLITIFIFLTGLIVGSFLNCVIYRLEQDESFLKGRSYCPHCKHVLSWKDLIPIVSFFTLRGKCRYCQKKISRQYPLVELATGILFILVFNFQLQATNYLVLVNFLDFFGFLILLLVSCLLLLIFVFDLKHYLIPDQLSYAAIISAAIYQLVRIANFGFRIENLKMLLPFFYSALGAAAFFLFLVLVSKGKWMGEGDIKLAFFMGLFLGWPAILAALFLAFFGGAIIGLGLIVWKKKSLKSEIPFGPFLIAGTFISLFWGEQIIGFYLNLLMLKY